MKQITADDLQGLNHKQQVMFAVFCARQVEHLIESEEAKRCIEIVELWLEGKATTEECREVAAAARAAGYAANAAGAAIWTAYTTYAAGAAARAARAGDNKEELIKQQHAYLYELKNIDKILEEELLS